MPLICVPAGRLVSVTENGPLPLICALITSAALIATSSSAVIGVKCQSRMLAGGVGEPEPGATVKSPVAAVTSVHCVLAETLLALPSWVTALILIVWFSPPNCAALPSRLKVSDFGRLALSNESPRSISHWPVLIPSCRNCRCRWRLPH